MKEQQDQPNRISPEVAAAMARLEAMRAAAGISPRPAGDSAIPSTGARLDQDQAPALSWQLRNAIKDQNGRRAELDRSRYGAAWSDTRSARLASSQNGPETAQPAKDEQFPTVSPQSGPQEGFAAVNEPVEGDPVKIRVYPDMTARAHKIGKDAQCRVYLFAQSINTTGSGRVELARLRSSLEGVYTWRRIRQIVAGGAGVFWTRIGDVLYLHGPARVLNALGGGRMTARPVMVEARHLRGGMHEYRAVFVFGSFLSGRQRVDNPISQAAVREATGAAPSTQRTYYRAAGVKARRGIKLIGTASRAKLQEAYWQQGRSVFQFVDYLGRHGAPGQKYIAQSIGSVYSAPMNKAASGRYRKVQRCLDLSKKVGQAHKQNRIYFTNGADAWRAYSRCKVDRAYYSGPAVTFDAWRPSRLSGIAVYIAVPGQ